MKITEITINIMEIPMVTVFTTAFGSITKKPTILVKIKTSEDIVGWGEAAVLPFPMYNPEAIDTAFVVLKNYIGPLVIGKEISSVGQLNKILKSVRGNNIAKTGLENAVWMAFSIKTGKSLSKMLGGTKKQVAIGESIGIKNSIPETLEEISLRLSEGFQRIKVKIRPGWDIKLIDSIRKKFPYIDLMVDGNSGYTLKDIKLLKKFDKYGLTMIEQPLGDDDIIDHATLQKQIKTPICLDESILSAEDARKAIEIGACKIINIKPGRVGGLLESKKIHDLCKKQGVGCWVGGMLEQGIGRAFNTAVASLPNCIYPADLSPTSFYYADSVIDQSLEVDANGNIKVPEIPGLGPKINEAKIKKYAKEKTTIK